MEFLRSHGAEGRAATPNSDMITATVSVEAAERMLSAEYRQLVHASGTQLLRTVGGYSLSSEVASAVDFVSPTTHVPGVRKPIVNTIDEQKALGGLPDI